MGKNTNTTPAPANKGGNGKPEFKPTFIPYNTMDEREKGIFKQGAATANNSIKERLGLKKPREDKPKS